LISKHTFFVRDFPGSEPDGRLLNQLKATPLRVPIKNLAMMASLSMILPVWDRK